MPSMCGRKRAFGGSDVAIFLPFECNKEQQTAARAGTKAKSCKSSESTRGEAESGNIQQAAAKGG